MAFSVYLLCFGLAYASYLADVVEWRAIAGFLIIIPVINVAFYIVFRTGLNRKMPDPSLTSIQMFAGILVTIALIGMPLVIAYTAGIYWVFRGKVKLTKTSY